MATVMHAGYPKHPSPPVRRQPQRTSTSNSTATTMTSSATTATATATGVVVPTASSEAPWYGHEETARICAEFVRDLFSSPDNLQSDPSRLSSSTATSTSSSSASASAANPLLCHFVAYALYRTRLHSSVTFSALHLLSRLKARFPAAKGSSGHRLFICAFMIASKVVCDDTYSNKSWCVVGQNLFGLKEMNQMEREMCGYLDWHLNVSASELESFEKSLRAQYGFRSNNGHHQQQHQVAVRPQNVWRPSVAPLVIPQQQQHRGVAASYLSPDSTPPTPSSRASSASSSPASSVSCLTPENNNVDTGSVAPAPHHGNTGVSIPINSLVSPVDVPIYAKHQLHHHQQYEPQQQQPASILRRNQSEPITPPADSPLRDHHYRESRSSSNSSSSRSSPVRPPVFQQHSQPTMSKANVLMESKGGLARAMATVW